MSPRKTIPRKTKARAAKKAAIATDAQRPFDPDTASEYMSRAMAVLYLNAMGLQITEKTLAQRASCSRRPGPPYRKFLNRAIYTKSTLIPWAESEMSAAACTTSERADLARLAGARKVTGKPKGKTAERSAAEAARP